MSDKNTEEINEMLGTQYSSEELELILKIGQDYCSEFCQMFTRLIETNALTDYEKAVIMVELSVLADDLGRKTVPRYDDLLRIRRGDRSAYYEGIKIEKVGFESSREKA